MTKIYELNGIGRALKRLVFPSLAAPPLREAPMQNSPKQAVSTMPVPRQQIDYSQADQVLELSARLRHLATVQMIPVRQHDFIPAAPHAAIAAKTNGIPDQRFGIQVYPPDRARESYDFADLDAPLRQQSVPGYITSQVQIGGPSAGYPAQAYKAPKPRYGGGQCNDG